MRVLKLKFSQEIINNGEKCGWLKQMRAADEKHVFNKWWPNIEQHKDSRFDKSHLRPVWDINKYKIYLAIANYSYLIIKSIPDI